MKQATKNEITYLNLLDELYQLRNKTRTNRTDNKTISVFGRHLKFDISGNHLPLLSTKFVSFKNIAHELIWMLNGENSIKYLKDNNVNIWDNWLIPNTDKYDDDNKLIDGISSSIYGESWRHWEDTRIINMGQLGDLPTKDNEGYEDIRYTLLEPNTQTGTIPITRNLDQIKKVIWQLKNYPHSRRILISSWNVARQGDVILPPCHYSIQFYVEDGKLSSLLNMRSSDVAIGLPYNIVQYTLLTHMLAHLTGLESNELNVMLGDTHLYTNLLDCVDEQLSRKPLEDNSPRLKIHNLTEDLKGLSIDELEVSGYTYLPSIKMDISI